MVVLVWIGAGMAVLGLAILSYCIVGAWKARKAGLDDAALRARLQRLVVWNLGALMVSMLGLMVLVAGIFLA
ncbi:hypothetical protein ILP92_08795 [Maribius pontilimi]|uniref:Uncharacterized protein n=1 Tax=Palleronia pontilimi TaxID=1964209 RepID=A0A934M9R8_9RHOB|nr:hypothetical protein [Palleronia pontilimi]MBJ3762842.1 hypothetical protein [Palleronia pontilimi]